MRHPILGGSGYRIYALVLLIVMLVHGLVLYFYYGFSMLISILDSLIYNVLFGVIAPGYWFVVRFASLNEKGFLSLLTTHFVAAFLTILLWTALPNYALNWFFIGETEYIQFMQDSRIWRVIIGFLYYSISVLVFYLIKYYLDLQVRVREELELKNLLQDSELRMLKSQINPHFIFNSLNSISALTVTKPETARDMVIKLSDFLRYSLGKDSVQMNTLEQEIQNVSLYLDIEKVRFGSKLNYTKEVDDKYLETEIPNLILQPLFENAVKYGVYENIGDASIQLKCEPKGGKLHISLSNTYDPEAVATKGEGIGLENVRKRLGLVFGRQDLLEVSQKENLFTVVMKIPLNQPTDE